MANSMVLYDKSECPFCWKVRLALGYKSIPFEEVVVDTANKPESFLRLSKTGKVPLLINAEQQISESTLIAHYLEDLKNTPSLFPGSIDDRLLGRTLNHYSDTEIGPAIRDAIFTQRNNSREQWDTDAISRCQENWRQCLLHLDQMLSSEHYFTGAFSIAECALLPRFGLATAYGLTALDDFPRLRQWYLFHQQTPLFQKTASARVLAVNAN